MRRFLLVCAVMMLALGYFQVHAQDRTVSGRVTAADGSPIPGVNIILKGTAIGTSTTSEGTYTLPVPATGGTLVISFIGYLTQEIEIGNRTNIDVQLKEDATQLEEAVVTAMDIKRDTRSLGYSTTTVKADELTRAHDRSALSSLQGKVAGARITNASGQVGSATGVILRGVASFTGGNQALIVVDGIPIDNTNNNNTAGLNSRPMGNRGNDINPADIESVTVLKGPAAAALYGSRAAGGVIMYTTKKGASGGKNMEVSITSSYMAESLLRVPKFQTIFGLGQRGSNLNYIDDQEQWGDPYDGSLRPYSQIINNQQLYKRYIATPGTVRDGMDIGHQFTNDIQIGGGDGKSNYFFSFSDLDQDGVVPGTYLDRQSLRINGGSKFNKVSINGSANYIVTNSNTAEVGQGNAFWGQNLRISPDIPRDEMRNYKDTYWDGAGFFTPFNDNPYKILGEWKNYSKVNRLLGNVSVSYDPFEFLRITYRVGGDVYSDERRFITPIEIVGPPNSISRTGSYGEQIFNVRDITSDLMVSFTKELTSDISLGALVGHNMRKRNTHSLSANLSELAIPDFYNFVNQISAPTVGGVYNDRSLVGVYGSVNASFKDMLFLEVTGRNDWSSTLPKDGRSFFYPSVSLGFVFSELMGVDAVDFAKLRVSYAEVGKDAAPYSTASGFSASGSFPFQGTPGVTRNNTIGSPTLKPERTKGFEIGLETRLLQNKIGLDIAYYNQLSEDQIMNVGISPTTGFAASVQNVGKIRNSGIELVLTGTPVKAGDFTWQVSANFAKNVSKVEELFEGTDKFVIQGFSGGEGTTNTVAIVGKPFGLWEYTSILRDPNGNIVADPTTGRLQKNTTSLTTDGRSIQPDWTGGITNTFSYKGFVFSFLFETSQGGTYYNGTSAALEISGKTRNSTYNYRQPWIIPGSVLANGDGTFRPNTTVFVTDPNQYWNNRVSEMNLFDATWVKLREASLTYQLPNQWLQKLPFKSVSLSLIGRNLLLFTPKENVYSDPEVSSFGVDTQQGYDFQQFPSVRSYGGSVRITF